jgi:hypothetical protein
VAQEKLADILKPINDAATSTVSPEITVKDFVEKTYLPFYRKKWKRLTDMASYHQKSRVRSAGDDALVCSARMP